MARLRGLTRTESVITRMTYIAAATGAAALVALMLLVVADVFMRNVFLRPIPAASESTELLLPYIVFWSLAYTFITGGHVRVTMLVGRFPTPVKVACEILACIAGMVFFGALTYTSWLQFWESASINEYMMAAINLPWWIGKFAMPIGCGLMVIQCLLLLVGFLQLGGLKRPPLVGVADTTPAA